MLTSPEVQAGIIRRIRLWHEGNPQPPVRLHFLPTDNCNLHCVFCGKGSPNYSRKIVRDSISRKVALGLVRESAELGVLLWSVSGGGEPTCVSYWLELLKAIKKNGMYGEMNTNATLFTEASTGKLVRAGWDHLIVSLDGADSETHDSLRGRKGSFRLVTTSIACFTHYKRQYKTETPLIGLAVVLCRRNASQLEKMIHLAHELGCGNVSFNPIKHFNREWQSPHVRDLDFNEPVIALIEQQIPSALDTAKSLGVETNLGELSSEILHLTENLRPLLLRVGKGPSRLSRPCYEPWYNLTIDFNGNVGHCCESHRGHPHANILTTSLTDAWYTHMGKIRDLLAQCRPPKYCTWCGAWQLSRTEEIRRHLKRGNI